jgi:iron(III) transport system permease protein
VFWRVTLPEAAGGLVMIGLLVGFLAATDLTIVDLLRVRTFAVEVYTQFALARLPSGPLLTALPIFLILLALLLGGRRRLLRTAAPDLEAAPLPRTRLGRLGPVLAVLAALGGGAGLFIVMLALARVLGTAAEALAALRSIAPDLRVTATLSLVSAVLIVVLAWPAARGALRPGWTGRILQLGVLALLALPAPVAGVGLITLLNQPGPLGEVYDSPAILVIGYLVRFWPVGVLLLIPAALRIAQELLDAGRVDGCGPIRLEWSISLPQARPALLAVLLISLILCIGEIGCSILIAPPGWSPVSVRAFTLMHFGVYRDLAVLAIVSIGLAAGPWLGLYWLLSQRMRTGT